jgi:hypothetical protein
MPNVEIASPDQAQPTPLRVRRSLGLLIALFLLFTAMYAFATPVFEGFDAQAYYKAATYFRDKKQLPTLAPETVDYSYELIAQPPLYFVLAGLSATGWPVEESLALVQQSANRYFNKGLSHRQSVLLPDRAFAALAPAWIARFVSMLGGLLTLLCTWWLARTLFPQQAWLASAAAAVAALNPQFLYTSVSITNDGWSAGTAALALALAARATLLARSPRGWLWAGLAVGVAGLTKYSALLVALPVGLLWLLYWRRAGWRSALFAALWAGGAFLAVAGWWFARNLLLYGEVVPLNRMAEVLPTMRRPAPYDLPTTLRYAPWLVASFWGVFVAVIAPGWYLDLTRWFMMIGFAGLAPAVRWLRNHTEPGLPIVYLVLLPWLSVVALSVLYWTSTIDYGEQGRLAHIGASAFGVTMAVGWSSLAPARWRTVIHALLVGFMVAMALTGFVVLRNAFALPPALEGLPEIQRPVNAAFGGGMQLVGLAFPEGAAGEPGDAIPVTLYFTTAAPIQDDYTLFVHLADANNQLLYQFDGAPVQGNHPTRQWIPGQVFADQYELTIPATSTPGLATLSLGFYPLGDSTARQQVYDAGGNLLGDRLVLAAVRVTDGAADPATAQANSTGQPLATWRNGILLHNVAVEYDEAGNPQGIVLDWGVTATMREDYTVFVQVLDSEGAILAQADRQPQQGSAPTSTWRAGDAIRDPVTWEGNTSRWARIIVGLYDAQGLRLDVTDPTLLPDAVQVATAAVSRRSCQPVSLAQTPLQCKLIRL